VNRARAGWGAVGLSCLGLSATIAYAGVTPNTSPALVSPQIESVIIDGAFGARAEVRCVTTQGAKLELSDPMQAYGARPLEARAFLSLPRRDGTATCLTEDGARASWRAHAMQIRAVALTANADHAVVTIDGQGLGPRAASDDGVYLVLVGKIVPANVACPEAHWSDTHVVACAKLAQLRGQGSVRVRVQAAGRLEEAAGAPLALPAAGAK
jgi:hypothetical protein